MNALTYFQHEMEMAKTENKEKRLWLAAMILFAVFMVSNVAWIFHFFW